MGDVAFFCKKYEQERRGLFGKMRITDIRIRYCVDELLRERKNGNPMKLISNFSIEVNRIV